MSEQQEKEVLPSWISPSELIAYAVKLHESTGTYSSVQQAVDDLLAAVQKLEESRRRD
jgi:hypothetical protein